MPHRKDDQPSLEQLAARIRAQSLDDATVQDAGERVWQKIRGAGTPAARTDGTPGVALASCQDFQAAIAAYLEGRLDEDQSLLVRDHTRSCVPCRRVLLGQRGSSPAPARAPSAASQRMWQALAASVLIAVGLGGLWAGREMLARRGTVATIEAMDGQLLPVGAANQAGLRVGHELQAGEKIRAGRDASGVVRLADGSLIELAPRAELAVTRSSRGTAIDLDRGNIIVRAAKQRNGHLLVRTSDCVVAVKGTIFAVTNGTKGSRVSVIEGRVRVDDAAGEHSLSPGEQVTTHPSMARIPVRDDIAWSRHLDEYLAHLEELTAVGRAIQAAVPPPAARASSRLLDSMPPDTVVYAAVPNLGRSLSDAYDAFQKGLNESTVLREWWDRNARIHEHVQRTVDRLHELGNYLGDEIVFTVQMGSDGDPSGHVVMAELSDGAGLESFISAQTAADSGHHRVRFAHNLDELLEIRDLDDGEPTVWLDGDRVAAADDPELLVRMASAGAASNGVSHDFRDRIAEAYRDGVSWLLAADLESMWSRHRAAAHSEREAQHLTAMERMGLLDLRHVIFEQRDEAQTSHQRARLSFDQARRGIPSWLAAPAPMGTLAFVSPDAALLAAFVVKEPLSMLDDLEAALRDVDSRFFEQLGRLESETGLRVREDLAAPLGGEVALAVDGPLLPRPSWKVVLEVYDPGALLTTIERLVGEANRKLAAHGEPDQIVLEHRGFGGQDYYTIRSQGSEASVDFAFADGYVVVAPGLELVRRAVRSHETGINLARSPRLSELFPLDGHASFSALAYQNLAAAIAPVAEQLGQAPLTPEQQATVQRIAAGAHPSLIVGYGGDDEIVFAGRGAGGLFGVDLPTLISLQGLLGIDEVLGEAPDGAVRER